MRKIVVTNDGSHTIVIPEQKVTYHSVHGAIQESAHVFIEAGLKYVLQTQQKSPLHVFEMGFGSGLNCFLTAIEAVETKTTISYTTVDTSPLLLEEVVLLNYSLSLGHEQLFQQLHKANWNDEIIINEFFTLEKRHSNLQSFMFAKQFHLIYYDAFAPTAQPELWTKEIFEKLFCMLRPQGILVTYCSKGDVKRAMIAAGFAVKKLPGPPGKREMLRAERIG